MQNPVIVIPGVTGSQLHDEYPVNYEDLWTAVLSKNYERIYLHPDNVQYEALEPALVRHGQIFDIAYGELIDSLRHELSPTHTTQVPVYPFPYDWRIDIHILSENLKQFIDEVIARTKLLRYYDGWIPKVDIVTHSMGSLIFAKYFSKYGKDQRIGKVATIAGPYQGSIEAVAAMITGIGYISGKQPSPRERELARMCASIYQFLPRFENAVTVPSDLADGIFTVKAWQLGVIQTIQEYIKQYGLKPNENLYQRASNLMQGLLSSAINLGNAIDALSFDGTGVDKSKWLAIVGIGADTRVHAEVKIENGLPRFYIGDFVEEWKQDHSSFNTGDTTVPLRGAIPKFHDINRLVAVTPDDFGFLELKDKAINMFIGLHAQLPNMDLVQRLVIKHLMPEYGGQVWGRFLPGVTNDTWNPPIKSLEPK